jgi:NitT/TauT family transport system substrate-binding protein
VQAASKVAATSAGMFKDESIVTETMAMCMYNWRDVEPEETLRFFGLRLADAKLIKSTPQQLIAAGTDLAYMRQLRTELKS